MQKYKTGKKPARPGAVRYKFASLFDASMLPVPPLVFGRTSYFPEGGWGMLGNDEAGCCVEAEGAHSTMLLNALGGHGAPRFTKECVWADYAALTGFDPTKFDREGNNPTDNGTDMTEAAQYHQRVGVLDADGNRHKIDGFVSLHPGNVEEVALAAYLFGTVSLGAELPKNAEGQFDAEQPWSLVRHPGHDGGHCFPCVGRNHEGNLLVVTWGRLHAVEPAWLAERMDEGVVYISREGLRGNELLNQRNLDWPAIERALGNFR